MRGKPAWKRSPCGSLVVKGNTLQHSFQLFLVFLILLLAYFCYMCYIKYARGIFAIGHINCSCAFISISRRFLFYCGLCGLFFCFFCGFFQKKHGLNINIIGVLLLAVFNCHQLPYIIHGGCHMAHYYHSFRYGVGRVGSALVSYVGFLLYAAGVFLSLPRIICRFMW